MDNLIQIDESMLKKIRWYTVEQTAEIMNIPLARLYKIVAERFTNNLRYHSITEKSNKRGRPYFTLADMEANANLFQRGMAV